MEQPAPRPWLFVSAVAVVAFLVGLVCGIGVMVIVSSSLRLHTWSELRQTEKQKVLVDINTRG